MAGSYTLELELFSLLNGSVTGFEIWAEGSQFGSTYTVSSTGSSISVTIPYGGSMPTSLEFRFNDTDPGSTDRIEVRSVKINDQYVNTSNYLSDDVLDDGQTANVDVAGASLIIDSSDPDASEFTTGATQTFTAGADNYRGYNSTTDQVFDLLDGNDNVKLGSGNDKVNGGSGRDTIRGGAGNDLISGGADNDRLFGQDGDDTIYGGTGNDMLFGNDGADELFGGDGNDSLSGHNGEDIIVGGAGDDRLSGGADDDQLFGGADNDQLVGGFGNDTLDGGDGDDDAYGGLGDDHINGGDGNDILVGHSGDDTIHGDDGDDTIYGMEDDDILFGGADNDYINGGLGTDIVDGGTGIDILVGGAGADTLNGGAGDDVIHGHGVTQQEIYAILSANANIVYSKETNSFYEYVTNSTISWGAADAAAKTSTFNGVTGHLAVVTSQTEADYLATLHGETAFNRQIMLGGSDIANQGSWVWLYGPEAGIQFSQGDTAVNNMYTDWLGGEPNNATGDQHYLHFHGNQGFGDISTTQNHPNTTGYLIEWEAGLMNDDDAIDIINGGAGNDTIYGYGGADILNGGANTDIIYGGLGNDVIDGGDQSDTLYGQEGDDTIDGGAGADYIFGDVGSDTIDGGDNSDFIYGGAGADILIGGQGNDLFYLANGDFEATESISGGDNLLDEIIFTNATTIDFTTGTLDTVEVLTGSDGDDVVTYSIEQALGFSTIDLGDGTDTTNIAISGTINVSALGTPTTSNVEIGNLTGSTGNDQLTITGTQFDALVFGGGILDLDTGTDYIYLNTTSTSLNSLAATDGSIVGVERFSAQFAAVGVTVNVAGQTENFDIIGGSSGDTFTGGSGADNIQGQAGNDFLYGGAGNDLITLGFGDDSGYGGDDNDFIYAGVGTNFLYGENGNDYLNSGTGNDLLDGGTGTNTVGFAGISSGVTVDLRILIAQDTISAGVDTFVDIQNLIGSAQDDTLTGDSNNNIITGDFGNDIIDGGDGDDDLQGQDGVDTVSYASASAGVTVDLSNSLAQDTIGAGVDRIRTFENLTGSAFNDTLTGDNSSNVINGGDETAGSLTNLILNGSFEDTSNGTGSGVVPPDWTTIGTGWGVYSFGGGRGSEGSYSLPLGGWTAATGGGVSQTVTTVAGQNYDLLLDGGLSFGGAGDATLRITVEDGGGIISQNDIVSVSSAGMEQIFFNFQANSASTTISFEFVAYTGSDKDFDIDNIRLYETNGDVLYGGDGLDTLTGGTGNDRFVFEATTAFNDIDVITDFNTAERDVLDLSDLINDFEIGINPIQDNITNFLQITDDGTDSSVFVDTTGSGTFGAATQIATLQGVTGLTDEQALLDQSLIYVYDN